MAPRAGRPRVVTLSTDVGSAYAAQMKGVLLHSLPPDRIVDLTHDLPAHGVREAAFVVRAMATPFPAGSVHLVVVDPGVGGGRAPLAAACADGSRLVGPDNGVLLPLAEALGGATFYRIDPRRVVRAGRVGTTFDGRDLFAPAAAQLARGVRPSSLGPTIVPVGQPLPHAVRRVGRADGEVVHIDRFGNLITNIPSDWVPRKPGPVTVRVGSRRGRRVPWATSYAEIGSGRLGALGSSFGTVEVAVGEGRAARRLQAAVGDTVALRWRGGRARATSTVNSDRPRRR